MNINSLIIAKSKNSAKLVLGVLLVTCGLIQGYPKAAQTIQEQEQKSQQTKLQTQTEEAKEATLDQQVADGKLLAKQTELAKTRIFSGAAHFVVSNVPNGAPIQIKTGQKYYGVGDVNNPIPLPTGTVVRDAFCGTGIIAADGTLQDYASAQGECVQITEQIRNAQLNALNHGESNP